MHSASIAEWFDHFGLSKVSGKPDQTNCANSILGSFAGFSKFDDNVMIIPLVYTTPFNVFIATLTIIQSSSCWNTFSFQTTKNSRYYTLLHIPSLIIVKTCHETTVNPCQEGNSRPDELRRKNAPAANGRAVPVQMFYILGIQSYVLLSYPTKQSQGSKPGVFFRMKE